MSRTAAASFPPTGIPVSLPRFILLGLVGFLCIFLLLPLYALVRQSLFPGGTFSGAASFRLFLDTPGLLTAFTHTLLMGAAVTIATLVPAFLLAYALTHTRFAGRKLCSALALLPIFVPSLFPSLGLIYLFGPQGFLSGLLGETSLYGPLGILLGSIIYTLPHALLPLVAALREVDADLYTASRTLGGGPLRCFFTVTLPAARYGLTSSAIIIFILTITDFGIPKVLGGDYSMLATEIFKQIVGMQDFSMGGTVSLALLLSCIPAFILDYKMRKKQRFLHGGNVYAAPPHSRRDAAFTVLGWTLSALPLAAVGTAVWGSFIAFWPYDLEFTLTAYAFKSSIYGPAPVLNSVLLALAASIFGTLLIFCGAYLVERGPAMPLLSGLYRFTALLPLAIPGIVLGLAYILAFNTAGSPMQTVYGTIPFLACNCVVHFYTVCHFTASGGLARLDPNYETAGATLGVSRARTFAKVVVPLQGGTLADIAFYLFINALTTISAVIFLYSPDTMPASVAVLQLLDSGAAAEASAMGTLLLVIALAARCVKSAAARYAGPTRRQEYSR